MTDSLNDVLKYEPVRRFLERSSLAVALAECDPFIDAVPCWQDHKEMDECADRLMRRAIAQEWITEADYFEVLAIADAIERLDRRKLNAPFYADVSIAEALQYQSFMGLRAVAMDAGNSIHVQRRGCEVLELLAVG